MIFDVETSTRWDIFIPNDINLMSKTVQEVCQKILTRYKKLLIIFIQKALLICVLGMFLWIFKLLIEYWTCILGGDPHDAWLAQCWPWTRHPAVRRVLWEPQVQTRWTQALPHVGHQVDHQEFHQSCAQYLLQGNRPIWVVEDRSVSELPSSNIGRLVYFTRSDARHSIRLDDDGSFLIKGGWAAVSAGGSIKNKPSS